MIATRLRRRRRGRIEAEERFRMRPSSQNSTFDSNDARNLEIGEWDVIKRYQKSGGRDLLSRWIQRSVPKPEYLNKKHLAFKSLCRSLRRSVCDTTARNFCIADLCPIREMVPHHCPWPPPIRVKLCALTTVAYETRQHNS